MHIMAISVCHFPALTLNERDSYRNRWEAEMMLKGSTLYVYIKHFYQNPDTP